MKDAATKHPKSSCFAFDSKQHVGFASRSPSATISLHATVATCCNSHLTREYCCHTCVVSVARPSVIPAFTDAIGEFSHICGPNCVALHRNFLTFENECDADRNSRTLLDPRQSGTIATGLACRGRAVKASPDVARKNGMPNSSGPLFETHSTLLSRLLIELHARIYRRTSRETALARTTSATRSSDASRGEWKHRVAASHGNGRLSL